MSQPLESALIDPDDKAACQSLHELLNTGAIPSTSVPQPTPKAYLQVFCDRSRSLARRRWSGLVLAWLVESYPHVAQLFRRDPVDLVRVGAVVLTPDEAEETKIVAGLIIRAGLSQGISFSDFWSENKVHATATTFPTNANGLWMKAFQDYMDTLAGRGLGYSSPELVLCYPIALHGADGYGWAPDDENLPLLLIENQTLTMITPASSLGKIEFIYIQFSSIKHVRLKQSTPYDSQGGVVPAAPWAIVLEFKPIPTKYAVNCSDHSGSDFTIILGSKADAEDCLRCINDVLFPKGSLTDAAEHPSPAADGHSSEERNTEDRPQKMSCGGVIMFDRSQRRDNSQQRINQALSPTSKAVIGASTEKTHVKAGALPQVKKALRSSILKSDLHAKSTEVDSNGYSPSVKRPAKTRPLKPHSKKTGKIVQQDSTSNLQSVELATFGLESNSQNLPLADKNGVGAQVPKEQSDFNTPHNEDVIPTPENRQVPCRLSDKSTSLQETEIDGKGVREGKKRTRGKLVSYKEDSSFEDASDFELTEHEKTQMDHSQPSQTTTIRKDHLGSLSAKKLTNTERTKQSKPRTRPLKPLKGSSLSNLKPTTGTTTAGKPSSPRTSDTMRQPSKDTMSARTKDKMISHAPFNDSPSSEAHILAKLNNPNIDEQLNGVYASEIDEGTLLSRKRTAATIAPSTPRCKKARLNYNDIEAEVDPDDYSSIQSPLTVAPVRVLQDPSSPCGNRKDRSMQAPPKPTGEDATHMSSPKLTSSSVRRQREVDQRQTPVHQLGKRTLHGTSASLEILSSNSKPTPASPRAASRAISGHADRHELIMEQTQADNQSEKKDPFQLKCRRANEFTRRLAGNTEISRHAGNAEGASQDRPIKLGDSPSSSDSAALPQTARSSQSTKGKSSIAQPSGFPQLQAKEYTRPSSKRGIKPSIPECPTVECSLRDQDNRSHQQDLELCPGEVGLEGDTLIDIDEPREAQDDDLLLHFRSSPPPMDLSPSSHSSTSAEGEPKTDPHVPTSQAEEVEWEASLQPYQRDLKDQLLRVSNRVLQHILNNESAVNDVAKTYATDGQDSLSRLLKQHGDEVDAMHKHLKQKTNKIAKATEDAMSRLQKERRMIADDDDGDEDEGPVEEVE